MKIPDILVNRQHVICLDFSFYVLECHAGKSETMLIKQLAVKQT